MSGLQMPTVKGKRDGEVEEWSGEAGGALCMRGNYSPKEIVSAAFDKGLIDSETAEVYLNHGRHYQSWFKNAPRDGYTYWAYPFNTPVRGAYFASVLSLD